ncbi:MAG TPA: histidine kinase [Pseudonocardiaceae bacterium]|jgi:signal transduction histidine kinase|nr:histidine kinase [Pseudonocardiaceae bacterium]
MTALSGTSEFSDRFSFAGRWDALGQRLRTALRRIPRVVRIVAEEILVVGSSLACVLLSHPSTFAFAAPAAVIACLALPLRLRWPWLAMLACLVALSGGLGLAPAIAGLYRVGRRDKPLVILGWATAAVLASAVPVLITQDLSWSDATLTVAFSILWMTAPSAGGVLITTRQQLTESLAELRRARQAELEAREEQARAQERTRIGQEIHDAVGHHATLIAVEAAALASTTEAAETRRVALRVRALAKESLSEMRAALGLADEPQEAGSGLADLPVLLGRARQAGVQISFDEPESLPTNGLAPVVGRAVFRIVQESLTNATKYAPGTLIRVRLTHDGAQLMVSVVSGPPVAPTVAGIEGGGMGLAGMAERARTAGGTLQVERDDDGLFTVRARLPLRGHPLRK